MIVIGVDPGLTCTGCAVLSGEKVLEVRAFKGMSGPSLEERCWSIAHGLLEWTKVYWQSGTVLAIENNHVTGGRSVQTAMRQRELIGVIAAMASAQGLEVRRVAPATAKKSLTGSGKAGKEDMVEAANKILWLGDLTVESQRAVADAIGIALAAKECSNE